VGLFVPDELFSLLLVGAGVLLAPLSSSLPLVIGTLIRPEANSSPVNLAEFSELETCAWEVAEQNTPNAVINSKNIFRFINLPQRGIAVKRTSVNVPSSI